MIPRSAKYLAWDLDGTLCDMDRVHFDALNVALALCGPQALITPVEHLVTFKGLPTRRKLAMLLAAGRVAEADVARVAERKQHETIKAVWQALHPEPEKLRLLRALRDDRWRMCVCSNAVRRSVKAMLHAAGLAQFMEFYLSNEDAEPKPSPMIYLRAAEIFGVAPERMVVVEDAEPGRRAALAAGCRLVAVEGPEDVTLALLPDIYAAAEAAPVEAM